jgi:hypothetical protein
VKRDDRATGEPVRAAAIGSVTRSRCTSVTVARDGRGTSNGRAIDGDEPGLGASNAPSQSLDARLEHEREATGACRFRRLPARSTGERLALGRYLA